MRNNGIFALPFENGPLYNLVHVKLVVIIQRNHSNGLKLLPISFNVNKIIIVKPNVEIPMPLTTWIPSHSVDTTKLVPPNSRGDPLKLPISVIITFMHLYYPIPSLSRDH